ncbi:hypothetical protein TYRP_001417 [Tyrophagus putrescentiae]|nr:hypothetical protein TYRP_001417 [Tyrophagus putrescentiae]
MDSGLCVSMRAAQDPASLKTKSTVWTLAPRRGARSRTLVLGRSAGPHLLKVEEKKKKEKEEATHH